MAHTPALKMYIKKTSANNSSLYFAVETKKKFRRKFYYKKKVNSKFFKLIFFSDYTLQMTQMRYFLTDGFIPHHLIALL